MAARFTIGVEEEYQLVDPESGVLRSGARWVRRADRSDAVHKEMQESTVEIATGIACNSAEALAELRNLRLRASAAAEAEGLSIVAAGLHPFSRWEAQTHTAGERYEFILDKYGRIARDQQNFGMHVHVALDSDDERIAAMNVARSYLPMLLALSASSPFYEGTDTSFASFRTIAWRRWPNSGVPPRFRDFSEYRDYVDVLLRAGAISDEKMLYWSLRPHGEYPTIEFRAMDVCPSVEDAAAIAGLARLITIAAVEGELRADTRMAHASEQEMLEMNEWRAARYGMDAELVDPAAADARTPMRDAVLQLIERLALLAEPLGEAGALEGVEAIVRRGSAAARMRHAAEEGGLAAVTRWLIEETRRGSVGDRRRVLRA